MAKNAEALMLYSAASCGRQRWGEGSVLVVHQSGFRALQDMQIARQACDCRGSGRTFGILLRDQKARRRSHRRGSVWAEERWGAGSPTNNDYLNIVSCIVSLQPRC